MSMISTKACYVTRDPPQVNVCASDTEKTSSSTVRVVVNNAKLSSKRLIASVNNVIQF